MQKLKERAAVNFLLAEIDKNSVGEKYHYHVDRDTIGMRQNRSGWDFLLLYKDFLFFCEAKIERGRLTDFQALTQKIINGVESKHARYVVLRFFTDGKKIFLDENFETPVSGLTVKKFMEYLKKCK